MAKAKAKAPAKAKAKEKVKKREAPTVKTYLCVKACYFQKRMFKPTRLKTGFHTFSADTKLPTYDGGKPCFEEVSMGHSTQAKAVPSAPEVPEGPYIRPENEIPVRQVTGKGGVGYGVPIKPHGPIPQ